ncbi:complex I NDUFA9 subunit family protein [Wenzhouxiangella sp. XN24]|uniref:complex I NDUFA9 subunit family protein n=1 Tax=Wenzhouxiangella sp. XN24 TaxID=2713569 RepID=UPI0013EB4189|nr:complex I NDUFA9 subunit family protein [Wenzhouxiangella sp. XN24]NGX16055.1 complex I NDUFA9 subunit family protein [Wenzhouxiangella sp. XN24]
MSQGIISVFGGTGFLGDNIARALVTSGYPVRIVARHPARPGWARENHEIELEKADIRDEAGVERAVAGAAAVVNAVSLYVESGGRDTFEAMHVQGARQLARAARDGGASRFVLVSGIGSDKQSPSHYIRARAQGEEVVREAFPGATIVRPSVIFGRGDAFLSALVRVTRAPVVPLFGHGETRLQPVWVRDVARAVAAIIRGRGGDEEVFELGGTIYRYRKVVEMVLEALGRRRLLLPVPFALWRGGATLLQPLPNPPLTRDQALMMQWDNVVNGTRGTFQDLGLAPSSLRERIGEILAPR